MYQFSRDVIFVVKWPSFHKQNFGCHVCHCIRMSTRSTNFLRLVGDPQKQNCENAGFVTSSKFTYFENLYIYVYVI